MCSLAGGAWSRAGSVPGARLLGNAPRPPLPRPALGGPALGRLKNRSSRAGRRKVNRPNIAAAPPDDLADPRSHGQQGLAGPEAASAGGGPGSG